MFIHFYINEVDNKGKVSPCEKQKRSVIEALSHSIQNTKEAEMRLAK